MAEVVRIPKSDASIIKEFTKNSIFDDTELQGDYYVVSEERFNKIVKEFILSIRLEEKKINYNLNYVNYDRLNELSSEYKDKSFGTVRNNYHHLSGTSYSNKDLLEVALSIAKEITNIKKIPVLIKEIEKLIIKVSSNDLSYMIETTKALFNKLKNNGGTYDEYLNIKKTLELEIRKTYIDNISEVLSNEFEGNYLIEEDGEIYILNKSNAYMFSYGLIYSPRSIVKVTNGESDIMIPFNEIDGDSYKITINKEDKPIGVYSVSMGEKELSENYVAAEQLTKSSHVNFCLNIDVTKFIDGEDLDAFKIDFIKKMLVNRNRFNKDGEVKDSYFEKLDIFFERFAELKKKDYNSEKIINLFEDYLRYIYGESYRDVSLVLKEETQLDGKTKSLLSVEAIKDIFENNIYYDFNIFTKENLTNNDIALFVERFYRFKDNRLLNLIYPGIKTILISLNQIKDDSYDNVVSYLNSLKVRDSWLIASEISKIIKKEAKEEESYVEEPRDDGSRTRHK